MSQLEKNLYKRVAVSPSKQSPKSGKTYRGFSTVNSNHQGFALYDFELIKQDLVNHFHIKQGEKLSDPTFGTILWFLLYEQFTPEIEQAIIDDVVKIINYDPRITAENVTVESYDRGIIVECIVTYLKYNISENLRFRFDQANSLVL